MIIPSHDDITFYANYLLGPFACLVFAMVVLGICFYTNRKDREKQRAEHKEDIATMLAQHQEERNRDAAQQKERNNHNDNLLELVHKALDKCQDNERLQWNRTLLYEQALREQGLSTLNLKVFDQPNNITEGEI